jgi:AcrR family transcriptional regulator
MPKVVDHQARRRRIADALMRVASARGLEAVSLRHVAAEAGVSTGMVQHYFRTKDEMMTFAIEMIGHDVQARLAQDAAALGENPAPRAVIRALMVQILPLDDVRRREAQVGLAFMAYTAVRPDAGAGLRTNIAQMRGFLAGLIGGGTSRPDIRADPEGAAALLLALVDGLGLHVVNYNYSPEDALKALDSHLDSLFGTTGEISAVGTGH